MERGAPGFRIRARPARISFVSSQSIVIAFAIRHDSASTAEAISVGGRDGGVRTADGSIDLQLAVQKELGGPGGPKSNPEDLFAAGYAACFHSALKLAAGKMHVPARDSKVTARVGIGPEGESFALEVDVQVSLPGIEPAKAEELVHAAHSLCPYSKATRGNIPVRLSVVNEDGAVHALA